MDAIDTHEVGPGRAAGERARFEGLYRAHRGQVVSYLRRRGAGDPEALAAETLLTLWRRLDDVDPPELPWLYRTAGYLLANDRRARDHAAQVPGLLAADPTRSPRSGDPAALVDTGPNPALAAAFINLGEVDREVLRLVAWEDLAGADLAAALGCSRAAARVRLLRARRRLTAALSPAPAFSSTPTAPRPPAIAPGASAVPVTAVDGGTR